MLTSITPTVTANFPSSHLLTIRPHLANKETQNLLLPEFKL